MSDPTTAHLTIDALVHQLTTHLASLTQSLSQQTIHAAPTLQQLEVQVLHALKEVGGRLLAGLCHLLVPHTPPPTLPCACGATAAFQRSRPATCRTLLGTLSVTRPYYLCATCHHGFAPFDQHVGWCAGGRSAGLDELLALLGATQDSFADAASVLARVSLVQVAPNTVRTATEELGQVLADAEQAQVAALEAGEMAANAAADAAPLCVSLDGVQAHLTPEGWKELCVGAVYQVRPCRPAPERRSDAVQAEAITYVAELGSQREAFGWQLYAEAQRRGAAMREVAVVGDGAAWLWTLAELHFPQATQILDWFHATAYVWSAATAIWGEGTTERTAWAERQLAALWDGQVGAVLVELQRHAGSGAEVTTSHTYFTNQQGRMDYPAYRSRGLPMGSGTIESGCKQVVSRRLKGAGMIWRADGARQVVKVRAWLKSGRWTEAMALRGVRQRRTRTGRLEPGRRKPAAGATITPETAAALSARTGLPPNVLRVIRDELRQQPAPHPWRRAWSQKQHRQSVDAPAVQPVLVSSA